MKVHAVGSGPSLHGIRSVRWTRAIRVIRSRSAIRCVSRIPALRFVPLVALSLAACTAATYEDQHQYSEGTVHVLVNGAFAIRDGEATMALAGRSLVRGGAAFQAEAPDDR